MSPTPRPAGTWRSPIDAAQVAAGAVRLRNVSVDGEDVYWVEARPQENGRHVLVRGSPDRPVVDVTPAGSNVRTRVHEYGGGAYVVKGGTAYYVEDTDQRVYRLRGGESPHALTPAGDWRFADFCVHPSGRWLVCVREDHTRPGVHPTNALVALPTDGRQAAGHVVTAGHDFYSTPRFSPDGCSLSWLAWSHPCMPWDGTELWRAEVTSDADLSGARLVAGGPEESVFQPGWSPDGVLYFVSDRGGWWNLYRLRGGRVEPVHPLEAEFGRPQWELGTTTWAFADARRLVTAVGRDGQWSLQLIDTATGAMRPVSTSLEPAESVAATPHHAVCVGRTPSRPDTLVRIDLHSGSAQAIRVATAFTLDGAFHSTPEAIVFPTGGGMTAHAFFYPPRNRDHRLPPGERPPLIVIAHGGPTAATGRQLNLELQFWTSRGFAVVDVNYGGSTGYGRAYRQRLNGNWGVVDVADCVAAAKSLAAQGRVDETRLIVRGRSAGGYITLAALTFHPGVFSAGASYYGIGDIEAMARDTHKFESRYFDTLIGPYPERRDVFVARSPVHVVDQLSCPLILFQGLEDKVVPPRQSQLMADAVRAKGLPVALLTFEGEQHGFRKASSTVRCLEAELWFYGAIFGFSPADPLTPIPVDNLEPWRRAQARKSS